MSTHTVIRLADAVHLPALTSLIERYWRFERIKGFDAAHIRTLLTDVLLSPDRGQIWIAQEGDYLVAYLLAVYLFSLERRALMGDR